MTTRNKWDLIYHLVFGTKKKTEWLSSDIIAELNLLFAVKIKELGGDLLACNGHKDHRHILASMPPRISVSDLVKNLKGYSSYALPEITWQRGYGAFTVDRRSVDVIKNYIEDQPSHHAD